MRRWLLHNMWAVPTFAMVWCLGFVIFDAFTGRWWALASTGLAGLVNAWVVWYYYLRKGRR